MARGCHGRLKKSENKKKWKETEELGETWLRMRKPTKSCSVE